MGAIGNGGVLPARSWDATYIAYGFMDWYLGLHIGDGGILRGSRNGYGRIWRARGEEKACCTRGIWRL